MKNLNQNIIVIFVCFFTIFFFNKSWANEEYDQCVEEMTKEAGEEMDYVYSAIIIQYCTNEFKNSDESDN